MITDDNPATTSLPADLTGVETFEQLWLAAMPALKGFLWAATRDQTASDDLLQSTALAAWQKYSSFDHSRSFTAWAIGIARFEVLNYRRGCARAKVYYDSELLENLAVAYEARVEDFSVELQALRRCLQLLPEEKQSVLTLRYAKDLPYDLIARQLGRPEGAVRTAVCRLRIDLRHCIERRLSHERIQA